MANKNNFTIFHILALSIFLVIISPNILSLGMFMDGLWYADIAKNLAQGKGSFWDLYFTGTLFTHFREHPPMAIGLLSLWYKTLGYNSVVEKLYSVSCYFVIGYFIHKHWTLIVEEKYKKISWLPLFFFITIPSVSWGAVNNMLENTMSIFTIASSYFILKSNKKNRLINISIAAILLVFAFLSKGFLGLFILTFPFIYQIFNENKIVKATVDALLFLAITLIMLALLFFFQPQSLLCIKSYINKQLLFSLQNVVTVKSRFYILGKMFTELLSIITICFLIYFIKRKKKEKYSINIMAVAYIIIGFCGVFPIMISLKQSGFYILATFPFFSIGFALLIKESVFHFFENLQTKAKVLVNIKIISFVLCCLAIIIASLNFNKINRDKNLIEDVIAIKKIIPNNSIININCNMFTNWQLHGYLHRYADISLDTTNVTHQYYLITKDAAVTSFTNKNYTQIKQLNDFNLYIKN